MDYVEFDANQPLDFDAIELRARTMRAEAISYGVSSMNKAIKAFFAKLVGAVVPSNMDAHAEA